MAGADLSDAESDPLHAASAHAPASERHVSRRPVPPPIDHDGGLIRSDLERDLEPERGGGLGDRCRPGPRSRRSRRATPRSPGRRRGRRSSSRTSPGTPRSSSTDVASWACSAASSSGSTAATRSDRLGPLDAGEVGEVHHLDAPGVVGDVGVGVVAEAGVLVLLVLGLVGDGHPLAGELAARQGADAAEDVAAPPAPDRRGTRCGSAPSGAHWSATEVEVVDQQLGRQLEVGRPPLGVGVRRVVGDRPCARAVGGQVLTPEQELDGVPAGRDVGLAALLVGLDDDVGGDLGVARRCR